MIKPKVLLTKGSHREMEIVKISFEKNEEILLCLKRLPNLKWSRTQRSWYMPYKPTLHQDIFKLLKDIAFIDYSGIRHNIISEKVNIERENFQTEKILNPTTQRLALLNITQEEKLKAFLSWMRSRRYSESTIGTYTDALRLFLRYFQNKDFEQINNDDLIQFNNEYILANKLSASYQNQVVNAVKLFFRTIQLRSMEIDLIHRPKRAKLLPNVLSKEEVKLILTSQANIKHKTMLSLIYSCGLRCGELLRLKFEHIDAKRNLLIIKQSKGKKDRIVPLSKKTVELLREYYCVCKPEIFLFEGQIKKEPYDVRSLQNVLKQAIAKAGITKPVSLHWLRHSYATHLLESGTDLRYIQEILGHSRSTTTEIYTHVSTKGIQNVISPFDNL